VGLWRNNVRPQPRLQRNGLKVDAAPQWRDSLSAKGESMSLYEGGFLPDFMKAMQYWYDNGFGGDSESTAGPFPLHSPVDLRWLEVFDSLYFRRSPALGCSGSKFLASFLLRHSNLDNQYENHEY
jgi:hypothetical protein